MHCAIVMKSQYQKIIFIVNIFVQSISDTIQPHSNNAHKIIIVIYKTLEQCVFQSE